jgi:hypothetical protein
LNDLERENPTEPEPHQQEKVSTTDPDPTYFSKGDRAPTRGYFDNYLIDNGSCVVLAFEATDARPSQEIASSRKMLSNCANKFGLVPNDFSSRYRLRKAEFLTWLETQKIVSYIPLRKHYPSNDRLYGMDRFIYHPETNSYECPERKRAEVHRYQARCQ